MALLEEALLRAGYCRESDLEQARNVQKEYGGRLGHIMLNMGLITEGQLMDCLCECMELGRLSDLPGRPQLLGVSKIRPEFLLKNNVFLLSGGQDEIWLATNDPFNLEIFSLVERLASKPVRLFLGTEEELRDLRLALESELMLDEDEKGVSDLDDEIDKLRELASEAPVIRMVNTLLSRAVQSRSSDIHFECFKKSMKVRFRVDGVMTTVEHVSAGVKLAVITRLKLLSGMNIAENRLPQDGRISIRVGGKQVDIRSSSVPTSFGESFVLRLLGKEDIKCSLESLGYFPDHLSLLREIAARPNGIILTTGPTGSGKTTTLYSILNELVTDTTKIVTVEDPVEYELEGINQIQVRPDIGYTFANSLRSILRQDPDIIMVGEIRDAETAEISIRASLTGHLVLSTLHTNTALSSITRLIDMGIEFFLLKASIIALMGQRLVRRLCPHCAKPVDVTPEVLASFRFDELKAYYNLGDPQLRRPVGCERCNHTGYIGRMAITEIIPFASQVQAEFEKDKNFDDPNKLGYRTMQQDGLIKAFNGIVALDEVMRVT
jgi:type II secretory ATPase GspE/PulE/Tfp pilus assembly ATPase PilB-like protein